MTSSFLKIDPHECMRFPQKKPSWKTLGLAVCINKSLSHRKAAQSN